MMTFAGTFRTSGLALLALVALASCKNSNSTILPGERHAIRPALQVQNLSAPVRLGAALQNAGWLQSGFDPSHQVPHLALAAAPVLRWSTAIGRGNSDRSRITSTPVVAAGVIYTLDAGGQVQASAADTGAQLWRVDLTPIGEKNGAEGFGGGLALDGGRLYVTTGFGALVSLAAANGAENWRYPFNAPLRGAPTVAAGRVFVVDANNVAYAIDGTRGKLSWQLAGPQGTGPVSMGGAAPAVHGQTVVLPFSAGRVAGVSAGGSQKWQQNVVQGRLSDVRATIGGLPGAPVIAGGRVIVGNSGGKIAALRLTTGAEDWSLPVGATGPATVIGGAVFVVSDASQLLRINAATGRVLWATQLPEYNKPAKRKGFIAHYGPVVAGGQVIVAGSDGRLRFFDPASGAATYSTNLPAGAASAPVVAAGVLYVQTQKGKLLAFQ